MGECCCVSFVIAMLAQPELGPRIYRLYDLGGGQLEWNGLLQGFD